MCLVGFTAFSLGLKPVIVVTIFNGIFKMQVKALIDTGSSKAYWVSPDPLDKLLIKKHLGDKGVASGLGKGVQSGCSVDVIDVNIHDGSYGIRIADIPITSVSLDCGKLFSLVLPYSLFLGMVISFDLSDSGTSKLILNTKSNQISYRAESNTAEAVTGVCIDTSDRGLNKLNAFN